MPSRSYQVTRLLLVQYGQQRQELVAVASVSVGGVFILVLEKSNVQYWGDCSGTFSSNGVAIGMMGGY